LKTVKELIGPHAIPGSNLSTAASVNPRVGISAFGIVYSGDEQSVIYYDANPIRNYSISIQV